MPLFCCKLFPTLSPKNKGVWEKIGGSWEKSRHYWEKSHVSWKNGNLVNNMVNAPTRPEGAEALKNQLSFNILTLQMFLFRKKCLFLHSINE